jgi:hypothetical protein
MPNTPIGVPLLYVMLHLRRGVQGAVSPAAKAAGSPECGYNAPNDREFEKVAALIRA